MPVTSADNKGEKGTALKLVKRYHHDNRKTVRLDYDEHSLRKAHWLRCCGSVFCGKIPKNASCWSHVRRNTKLKIVKLMQYIFIIVLQMQICIVVSLLSVIFWCKKNGIFTFKNEILKQADFASEWQKSRFWGLEISKFSGEDARRPPYKVAALPFHWTPYAKILDPPQKTQGSSWTKINSCNFPPY